jgi:hypothetical protein
MVDFVSQDVLLEENLQRDGNINFSEKQGQTFQREYIQGAIEMQRTGKIHGLVSLDTELSRSLSRDPLANPFAIDRRHFPLGDAGRLPRRLLYFIEGKSMEGKKFMRAVLVLLEHQFPEVLPRSLEVPVSGGASRTLSTLDEVEMRQPDLGRVTWELTPKYADFLRKNDFRVFLKDPTALFKEAKEVARVRDALKGFAVLPADAFRAVRGLNVSVTDWNLKTLSVSPGGKWMSHTLKTRNTVVAMFSGTMTEFGLVPADEARVSTCMREILVPYEGTITEALLKEPGGATKTAEFDAQKLLRDSVDESQKVLLDAPAKKPHPELSAVRATRTRFTCPYAFVSILTEGVFDAATGTVKDLNTSVRLPPSTTDVVSGKSGSPWRRARGKQPFSYKVQEYTRDSTGRVRSTGTYVEVGPEAFNRAAKLLDDINAIAKSLERAIPDEVGKAVKHASKL